MTGGATPVGPAKMRKSVPEIFVCDADVQRLFRFVPVTGGLPPGRPKETKKHAAVALAEILYRSRMGGKLGNAREKVARVFDYAGERDVRRVTNSPKCPIAGCVKFMAFDFGPLEEDYRQPVELEHGAAGIRDKGAVVTGLMHASINMTPSTLSVAGMGWIWMEGDREATYGEISIIMELAQSRLG